MKWAQFALLIPVWFITTSAAPSPVDVNEAGRVMAQLDDWRALMFVMMVLIFMLVAALVWAIGKLAKAVETIGTMREAISTLSQSALRAGDTAAENRHAIASIIATISRIESLMARIPQ